MFFAKNHAESWCHYGWSANIAENLKMRSEKQFASHSVCVACKQISLIHVVRSINLIAKNDAEWWCQRPWANKMTENQILWRYRVFWSLLSCNAVLRIIATTSSMMHAMFFIIFVAKNHAEWWCQTRKSCKIASSTVMSGGVCALELLFWSTLYTLLIS